MLPVGLVHHLAGNTAVRLVILPTLRLLCSWTLLWTVLSGLYLLAMPY
jgi:hypothetical protein